MGEGKTGVERLRELAREWEEHSWSSVGKVRARMLADIADQIEREAQASGEVGKVSCELDGTVGPMSRHAMAIALLDDWEREAIERERVRRLGVARDVSVSAYDLLPEEERAAIALVRDSGGLDAVREAVRLFEDMHDGLYTIDANERHSGPEMVREIFGRIMPRGYGWPRFEDGALAVPGGDSGEFPNAVHGGIGWVRFGRGGIVEVENDWAFPGEAMRHPLVAGERVKRPAPKALDADGAEIRVGDTVYLLPGDWCDKFPLLRCHEWDAMKVLSLRPNHDTGRIVCGTSPGSVVCYPYPPQLTHRAPVLAADGNPLREGETVYLTDSPTAFVVDDIMTREDGSPVVHLADGAWHRPQDLTHERPDSWERLEEDARKHRYGYWECETFRCCACPAVVDGKNPQERYGVNDCQDAMQCDLVRRAKALAERDR